MRLKYEIDKDAGVIMNRVVRKREERERWKREVLRSFDKQKFISSARGRR